MMCGRVFEQLQPSEDDAVIVWRGEMVQVKGMHTPSLYKNPQHWHERAKQMRLVAQWIGGAKSKAIKLRIAEDNDKLAERAELRMDGAPATANR
jgi:hypothetical protein